MEIENKHLEDLRQIRSIMERSSRFISLSGLSGIIAGILALIGAGAAWYYVEHNKAAKTILNHNFISRSTFRSGAKEDFYLFMFTDATLVLILALSAGIYLTTRQARKNGQSIWDTTSQRMLINLAIPLITGGFFCLILLYHGLIGLIAPAMLLFYGLSLINGSKYTLTDIRYLGFCEIALGLLATFYIGYGLLFWAIGFGVMHIFYGTIMYFKYEK